MPTYERHVLLVDDDPEICDYIRELLQGHGVQVTTAWDGRQALQMMQSGLQPDLIIADIAMPLMDGFEFFHAVRAVDRWTPIPFIILTAHSGRPVVRQAMMLGVDDCLFKPLDSERLVLAIYNRTKRTQELTRYAEAAHEELEYVRRDMARMFTHELSTPLVSLNIIMELLTKHVDNLTAEDAQEVIQSLHAGVARLNRLLEQMVLLIQFDTGERVKLIREAAHPGPLWDALMGSVNRARAFAYRQRHVDIHYDQGQPLGGEIMAHWESLTHALAEVLCNAIAFSPEAGVVEVRQWFDRDHVFISVADDGPGIPEDRRGDLFRRFRQFERERHDQQGVGVGLYLARSIVEAHGGTLNVDSEVGRGTTVTLSFPLLAPVAAPPPEQAPETAVEVDAQPLPTTALLDDEGEELSTTDRLRAAVQGDMAEIEMPPLDSAGPDDLAHAWDTADLRAAVLDDASEESAADRAGADAPPDDSGEVDDAALITQELRAALDRPDEDDAG